MAAVTGAGRTTGAASEESDRVVSMAFTKASAASRSAGGEAGSRDRAFQTVWPSAASFGAPRTSFPSQLITAATNALPQSAVPILPMATASASTAARTCAARASSTSADIVAAAGITPRQKGKRVGTEGWVEDASRPSRRLPPCA